MGIFGRAAETVRSAPQGVCIRLAELCPSLREIREMPRRAPFMGVPTWYFANGEESAAGIGAGKSFGSRSCR